MRYVIQLLVHAGVCILMLPSLAEANPGRRNARQIRTYQAVQTAPMQIQPGVHVFPQVSAVPYPYQAEFIRWNQRYYNPPVFQPVFIPVHPANVPVVITPIAPTVYPPRPGLNPPNYIPRDHAYFPTVYIPPYPPAWLPPYLIPYTYYHPVYNPVILGPMPSTRSYLIAPTQYPSVWHSGYPLGGLIGYIFWTQ